MHFLRIASLFVTFTISSAAVAETSFIQVPLVSCDVKFSDGVMRYTFFGPFDAVSEEFDKLEGMLLQQEQEDPKDRRTHIEGKVLYTKHATLEAIRAKNQLRLTATTMSALGGPMSVKATIAISDDPTETDFEFVVDTGGAKHKEKRKATCITM